MAIYFRLDQHCYLVYQFFIELLIIKQFNYFNQYSTAAAVTTTILSIITTTMANLGIPLTGSTAKGFTLGIIKG